MWMGLGQGLRVRPMLSSGCGLWAPVVKQTLQTRDLLRLGLCYAGLSAWPMLSGGAAAAAAGQPCRMPV